jgi:ribosomal RNA-processing protein 12
MVDSNVALSTQEGDQIREDSYFDLISQEDAAKNVAFLQTQVESWLAVFFNVFSGMERDSRGMAGDVIAVWASIAAEHVCDFDSLT